MAKKNVATKNMATKNQTRKPGAGKKQAGKNQAGKGTAPKGAAPKSMAKKSAGTKASAGLAQGGSTLKSSVKRRSINAVAGGKKASTGLPGHQQDPKRRLGNFTSMGEHARVGGRTSGIVGQTTKDFRTDNIRTKSTKPRTKHGKGSR